MSSPERFDEQIYLAANPDVWRAVSDGYYKSGKEHFEVHGHAENRPGLLPADFDEHHYLARNPSVQALVSSGAVLSGALHYALFGKDRYMSYAKPGLARLSVIDKLWYGRDPFLNFPGSAYTVDKRGWNSAHRYLSEAIEDIKPKLVIEVGVWKGGSSMTMARKMRDLHLDSVVISVDTWLGSSEHWLHIRSLSSISVSSLAIPNYFIDLPPKSAKSVVWCQTSCISMRGTTMDLSWQI